LVTAAFAVLSFAGGFLQAEPAEFRLTALPAPSASDVSTTVPASQTEFEVGASIFLEVWVQTTEDAGLSSASVDLSYDSTLATGLAISPTAIYAELLSGTIDNGSGVVDDLSGSHLGPCTDAVGVSPNWARLAVVEFSADADGQLVIDSAATGSPVYGTAICGVGDIDPGTIIFDSVAVTIGDPGVPAAPLADERFDINGTIKSCVTDADCKDGETGPDPQTVCRAGSCYVARQRFLSVRVNPSNAGLLYTYRISLDTGIAGSSVLGFTGMADPTVVTGPGPSLYYLTRIEGVPHYTDWTTLTPGYVSIGDCEVSPGNDYIVQAIADGADLLDEANYSSPLNLPSVADVGYVTGGGNPGDPPNGATGTLVDVFSMVKGFQSTQNEPLDRLDINPSTGSAQPNLVDAFDGILAFQGNPYAGPAPLDCP
jgi:hypothetical protein